MNKNILIGGLALMGVSALVIYLLFFRHSAGDGHNHADEESATEAHADPDDHAHEKMVTLTKAQYHYAGIDTGWFVPKNLSEVIVVNGATQVPPQYLAEVNMPLSGTISSILVTEGQYVKAGQTLATMNSLSYNNLRLEREKLQEQLLQAQANLEYLKAEFTRQKQLNEEKVTAGKVFQKISADLKMEEAKIASLQSQVAVLSQSIALAGNAASPLINITAPISGHVTHVGVTIGAAVEPARSLFSLADNTRMQVALKVYEKDLGRVEAGQKVRFLLTNQGNAEVLGKVVSIGKAFEDDTKAVTVLASIGSAPASLIPGMYVNAVIDLGENTVDALPVDAIVKAEGKEFIFLWEKENLEKKAAPGEGADHEAHSEAGVSFARIEVKTGESKLGFVQVIPLTEIHQGDKIVTKGAYYLQSHLLKSEGGGGHPHAH